MGDVSAEPSMEEILSSIKRIIAEEGDGAIATARAKRQQRATPPPPAPQPFDRDEVLELSDPVGPGESAEDTFYDDVDPTPAPAPAAEAIVSPRAAQATRGPLDALSRMVVKPEATGPDTLEGLVRELLRPMLRDWLDANLPGMVEDMVAREISRITGHR